eukprot:GDKH01010989.1.p4 GENE.GDKH01010989.1~~GDKH01010989.1.p4  ORF type:complete len:64 (+),score=8.73 GDKH01010989.1:242-433(+)
MAPQHPSSLQRRCRGDAELTAAERRLLLPSVQCEDAEPPVPVVEDANGAPNTPRPRQSRIYMM